MESGTTARLCARLPAPFTITAANASDFWDSFAAELESGYANRDFALIYTISRDLHRFQHLRFRPSQAITKRVIKAYFDTATIFPIENYRTQIHCCFMISHIMRRAPKITDLELPWRPYYRFAHHVVIKDDIDILVKNLNTLGTVLTAAVWLSQFFPKEATKEIVERLLPHVSPRGGTTCKDLTFLSRLIPAKDCDYKDWFEPFIVSELRDTASLFRFCALFLLMSRVIRGNIHDDFRFAVRPVLNAFNFLLVNDMSPEYWSIDNLNPIVEKVNSVKFMTINLARLILLLFLSPATRKEILEGLTATMIGAKMLFHPSAGEMSPTMVHKFVSSFLQELKKKVKEMNVQGPDAMVTEDVKPSDEEIHALLKPILDCYLTMIHSIDPSEMNTLVQDIRTFVAFDPSSLPRFFEFAFECITLTDAECVAQQAWIVMTAVYVSLVDYDILMDDFEKIFDIAVNSFYIVELQVILNKFFFVVFSVCPFNEDKVPEKLKKLDFCAMAVRFLTVEIETARGIPALKDSFAVIDSELVASSRMMFHAFLFGAGRAVIDAILPVVKTIVTDTAYSHANSYLSIIFNYYALVCGDKSKKILKKVVYQQLTSNTELVSTMFCLFRYVKISLLAATTAEEVRESMKVVLTFTNHSVRKIRKTAWSALGQYFSPFLYPNVMFYPVGPELRRLDEFEVKFYEIAVDTKPFVMEVFGSVLDRLLHSTDPKEITDVLKETKMALCLIVEAIYEMHEGDTSTVTELFKKSPLFIKELIRTEVPEVKEKFIGVICRLMRDFPTNQMIMHHVIPMCQSIFPVLIHMQEINNSSEKHFLKSLWGVEPVKTHYNCFELANRMTFVFKERCDKYYVPITTEIRFIFEKLFEFGTAQYKQMRKDACFILNAVYHDYEPLYVELLSKWIKTIDTIPTDEMLDFLTYIGMFRVISTEDHLICSILAHFCKNLQMYDADTQTMIQTFIAAACNEDYPSGIPNERSEQWEGLMEKLVEEVNEPKKGRTNNVFASAIVCTTLKYLKRPSPAVISYLLEQAQKTDYIICSQSIVALMVILKRMTKKEKACLVLEHPRTLQEFPVLFSRGTKETNKSESVDDMTDFMQNMSFTYEMPDDIGCYDSQSQGWHRTARKIRRPIYEPACKELFLPQLPKILQSAMTANDDTNAESQTAYTLFWEQVTCCFGRDSFEVLKPHWNEFFSEKMTEATATAISDYAHGVILAFDTISIEDCAYAIRHFIMPLVVLSSQNPQICEIIQVVFLKTSPHVDPVRFMPIMNFLWQYTSSDPDATLVKRQLLQTMSNVLFWRFQSAYTSIDAIFEEYLEPFFADVSKYGFMFAADLCSLYMTLMESTCVPEHSPLYTPELLEKRSFLMAKIDELLKKSNPHDKMFHQVLVHLFQYLMTASAQALETMLPVIIRNMDVIVVSLNSSDVNTEELLENAINDVLVNILFAERIDLSLDLVRAFLASFDKLAVPMQLKMLQGIAEMIRLTIHAYTHENLREAYELFHNLATSMTNDNVMSAIVAILGIISLYSDQGQEMSDIQAASIIAVALLFDEINPLVLHAFEIMAERIEGQPRSKTTLFQKVVRSFWQVNSEHMMPKVEEAYAPYRMLIAPPYIA